MDKNFKNIYRADLGTIWNEHMIDWELKQLSNAVQFEDDRYIVFNKPTIETHFCFGYGYCGMSTEEEYQDASNAEKHARTSEQYFIDENLKNLKALKEAFEDSDDSVYIFTKYNSESDFCNLMGYTFIRPWELVPSNLRNVRKLTNAERRQCAEAVQEEIVKFTKRLNIYLKRYGLSKLHTWTYLSD